ncbi:hypothetical protein [Robertkochia sediminum]|uniref:hypothetical protein n=1 Tax=Robertkochia sediminum TaxID=2785326 RepID=UPI00193340DD|nr:hypothetical protein [Robertkochia sediminum]MBL7472156.1 hypothetical protein [Robertkochia sediminum]
MKQLLHLGALILALTIMSCNQQPEQIAPIAGYWEIEKAESPDGETRNYKVNTSVDHYQLETDSTGFKTRLTPQFDGSFLTTGDREAFKVEKGKNGLKLHFTTPFSNHTETVILLKEQQLILTNEAGMRYTYKRYEKMNLE